MESDLDVVYGSLKRTENIDDILPADVSEARDQAADALAQCFAANVYEAAKGDSDEYDRRFKALAPKAMVMITCVVGVVRDMAQGNSNEQLDAFLSGVMNRGQA